MPPVQSLRPFTAAVRGREAAASRPASSSVAAAAAPWGRCGRGWACWGAGMASGGSQGCGWSGAGRALAGVAGWLENGGEWAGRLGSAAFECVSPCWACCGAFANSRANWGSSPCKRFSWGPMGKPVLVHEEQSKRQAVPVQQGRGAQGAGCRCLSMVGGDRLTPSKAPCLLVHSL